MPGGDEAFLVVRHGLGLLIFLALHLLCDFAMLWATYGVLIQNILPDRCDLSHEFLIPSTGGMGQEGFFGFDRGDTF